MRIDRAIAISFLFICLHIPAAQAQEVRSVTLNGGTEVWYIENHALPIVDIRLSFEGAGTAGDPAGKEGRAAFAAAMLTEGAGDYDALAFARALKDKAITLETSVAEDRLTVHVHALREHAVVAGELLAQALTAPRFDAEAMARSRRAMLTQLKLLQEDPDYLVARAFDAHAFPGHPYANPPYGTEASVQALNEADLREHLAAHVTRGRLLITAAGDVEDTLLKAVLKPLLAALPETAAPRPEMRAVAMRGAGESITEAHPLPQSAILFGAPAVPRNDKRFYTAYLLNQITGGSGLVSRFAEAVRQEKGLVYGIGSGLEVRRDAVLLKGWLATAKATTTEAIAAVRATLRSLQETGVSPKECHEARTYVLGSFPLELDGTSRLSAVLMTMRTFDLGKDYLEKREVYFNEVTCEDINALAKELLAPERFLFVTVGETGKEQP